jgi:hypothetical protein
MENLKVGDKVMFDTERLELFKTETNGGNDAIKQYQKLVLAGVNQVGIIKDYGMDLSTVSYPDGWEIPIPTKYLVLLPQIQ